MIIDDFVIGKLYNAVCSDGNIFYFKLTKIEGNQLKFIDWYIHNGYFSERTYSSYFLHDNKFFTYKEVDLSEIVKYLPLGHPERIFFRKKRIKNLLNKI